MTDLTRPFVTQPDHQASITASGEAPFEMANLRTAMTGLPFVVFVSQKGNARHGPRIKVSPLPRYNPDEAVTVTLESPPKTIGDMKPADLALVSQWIELNRATLEAYWHGDIEYTDEMMARIQSI